MSDIVTSTADILAILGGCTTFAAAIFAAVRLSRCQTVTCCWGAFSLVNKPLPVAPPSAPAPSAPTPLVRGESDLTSAMVQA